MTSEESKLGRGVRVGLTGLAALGVAAALVRAVLAGPSTAPAEKDVQKAAREIAPTGPGGDPRTEVPSGELVAGNGIVEPFGRETNVSAQVAGLVAEIRAKEGERVAQGAVLVELASDAERASLTTAEAQVAQAKAELDRVLRGSRPEEIEAADREAAAARARASLSKGVAERLAPLERAGAATLDEVDRARLTAAADQEAARASEARARLSRAGSRVEDIVLARAKHEAAVALRDEAKTRLAQRVVRAPIAGEVLQIKLRVGEYFTPGGSSPLLVLGDTSRLRVRMDLDERDVARVAPGAAAFVTADGFPGKRFPGKVAEIGRRMGRKNVRTDDPIERIDTKILEVMIDLDPTTELLPGLRVMSYAAAPKR